MASLRFLGEFRETDVVPTGTSTKHKFARIMRPASENTLRDDTARHQAQSGCLIRSIGQATGCIKDEEAGVARGRPSRATVYARLDSAIAELHRRLCGLPSPKESEYVWSDIWPAGSTRTPSIPATRAPTDSSRFTKSLTSTPPPWTPARPV